MDLIRAFGLADWGSDFILPVLFSVSFPFHVSPSRFLSHDSSDMTLTVTVMDTFACHSASASA